jgi:dolichol-phosphate mannosyltransferase
MKNSKIPISIILPTYNEAGNIIPLVKSISQNLKDINYEIIIVDDNSPDGTAGIVKRNYGRDKLIKIIIRKKNPGLALSILEGVEKSRGDYIMVMDTDFNHNPDDIGKFLEQKKLFNLIVGSRYIKGGGMENKIRYFFSYFYNQFIRFSLRLKTSDNLSGFFLIEKNCLKRMDLTIIFHGYGDYFIRLLKAAVTNNLKIKEVPVFYRNRISGYSKSNLLTMILNYSKTVADLMKNTL